ncbi:hypothetical protein CEXT_312821 [Caerostris extrusa]|uniref:Uncharacterized protein n=1 Tax=Caerostris extrusa TaxID=172846 RepID=A0AAV4SCF4_CAEEX|nr:hypothetical protein CEXT_312821 [Caerostris extrusa]
MERLILLRKHFEQFKREDYASITRDWEYLSDECPLPEVKHFFETVLPIKVERELVLHFFDEGSTLYDDARETEETSVDAWMQDAAA